MRTERERDDYKLRTRHGFPCGFPGEGSTDGNHHTSVDASSTGLIVPLRSEPTHAHRGTSDARLTQNSVRFAGWDGMNIGACRRGFTGLSFPFASCAGLNCADKRRPCTEPSAAHPRHCGGVPFARTALATPTPAPNPYARAVQAHCSASNGRNHLRVCKSVRWGGIRLTGPCMSHNSCDRADHR